MTKPIEVRNPRYAGSAVGDMVRALMRSKKPTPEKERRDIGSTSEEFRSCCDS